MACIFRLFQAFGKCDANTFSNSIGFSGESRVSIAIDIALLQPENWATSRNASRRNGKADIQFEYSGKTRLSTILICFPIGIWSTCKEMSIRNRFLVGIFALELLHLHTNLLSIAINISAMVSKSKYDNNPGNEITKANYKCIMCSSHMTPLIIIAKWLICLFLHRHLSRRHDRRLRE